MTTVNKPTVEFHSSGASGNVFALLGVVRDALRKQRRILDYNAVYDAVTANGSYDEAIGIIRQYAELRDLDGLY